MLGSTLAWMIAASLTASAPAAARSSVDDRSTIESVRRSLLRLPYYGVVDFLAFSYDNGTVTLSGYAHRPALKADAAVAVKRLAGVDDVRRLRPPYDGQHGIHRIRTAARAAGAGSCNENVV
jgi:osmotically-inducible protein OsmY